MKIPFELFFCLFDSKRLHGHNTPQRYSKNIYYYACYVINKKPAKKKRHNALIFFGEKPPQCGEEILLLLGGCQKGRKRHPRNVGTNKESPPLGGEETFKRRTASPEAPPQCGEEIYAIESRPMPYAFSRPIPVVSASINLSGSVTFR